MAEAKEDTVVENIDTTVQEAPTHITMTTAVKDGDDIVKHYAVTDMTDEAKILFDRQSKEQDNKNKLISAFNLQFDNQVRLINSLIGDLEKILPEPVELSQEGIDASKEDSAKEETNSKEKSDKKTN